MKYNVDKVDANLIRGWCFDEDDINIPSVLELYIDDIKVAKEIANIDRKDLCDKGIHPTGVAGFKFNLKETQIDSKNKIKIKVHNSDYNLNFDKAYKYFIERTTASKRDKNNIYKKRKLCIVHIGMHKTGSSSIQHNLNRTSNINFSYFDLGLENHSIPIYSLFSKNGNNYYIHKKMGRTEKEINNFNINVHNGFQDHIYKNMNYNTFIISGEDISLLSPDDLVGFRKYLLDYFEKIQIVAYVRSPISYVNSAVQQVIKGGEGNLQQSAKREYPRYKNKFDKFDTIFGKENVELYFFSKSNLIEGDATADFLYRQKLKVKEKKFLSTNESMSLESIALLYIFNKYSSKPIANSKGNQAKHELLRMLQNMGSKKFLLSKEYILKVVDYDKDDLLWIENRMDIKISDEKPYSDSVDSIGREEDLYEAAKTVINELKNIINDNQITKDIIGDSPDNIAKLMDLLYRKLYEQQ